ncbi:hypothetical protein F0U59_41755 [Archangium gephyra]|nr:hypothetical protein F0U59_41755 [Archangium gephyra]
MARGVSLINRCRRERVQDELLAFKHDLDAWLKAQRGSRREVGPQYWSQLDSVEAYLRNARKALDEQFGKLDGLLPEADFYEACRLMELRVLWLRRTWRFFRERFEQRDDAIMARILRAADEVVWSTWQPVSEYVRILGLPFQVMSAPLPFIDLEHSPALTRTVELVPRELKRDAGKELLHSHLRKLPVPLIHLPVMCIHSPWWLVFIGHEVGHQVQFLLGLDDSFPECLCQTVRAREEKHDSPDALDDSLRWKGWAREIFADVFSLVSMGTAALWAIAEFVQRSPESMRRSYDGKYPPVAIRLELMAQVAEALGFGEKARLPLRGMDAGELVKGTPQAERDLAIIPSVVERVLGSLPGVDTSFVKMLDFEHAHFEVDWPNVPEPINLLTSRRLASAALRSWIQTERIDTDAWREKARRRLAERAQDLLEKSYVPELRGDDTGAIASAGALGKELGELLAGMGPEALEMGEEAF